MDALLFGLSSSLAFGFLDLLLAFASRATTSTQVLVLAQAASVGLLLLCAAGTGQLPPLTHLPASLLLMGVGLGLVNALATVSLYKALAVGPLALISPLSSSYSLVTMLLTLCFLHEVFSVGQCITLLLVVAGIVLTTRSGDAASPLPARVVMRRSMLALCRPEVLFGLASMLGFGIEFFLQSLASSTSGPLPPLFWSRLCSTLMLLAWSLRNPQQRAWLRLRTPQLGVVLLIGLFDTLGMLCYALGANRGNTGIIAALSSTYPLLPMLLGVLLFRERLTPPQWMGAGCIVLGLCGLTCAGLS